MSGTLEGHVSVITGAATGMGAAAARRFVGEGARVVIADLKVDEGQALAEELGDACVFSRVDVTREDQVKGVVDFAVETWGRLDSMYNNAGFGGALGPITETTEDDYNITMDVLLKSVFFGIKHAGPVMQRQRSGSIVNTASIAGMEAGWGPHLYSTAKAAVIALTRTTAVELAEHDVRINAICPGVIATPLAMGRQERDAFDEDMADAQPLGRVGEPEEIANLALWLVSDESRFATGQAFILDGGMTLGRPWRKQPGWLKRHRPITVYRPPGR